MAEGGRPAPCPANRDEIHMSEKDYKDRRLFMQIDDRNEQRDLFKRYVHNVIIEGSSHCNRKCGYCPVSRGNRYNENIDIDAGAYSGIISQLAEIDYGERVCLNLYNEPMSQLASLLERIRQTRAALPKAHIYFSTNGDYLNRETLEQLLEAGLTSLIVSIHMPLNKPYDDNYILSRFVELGIRCKSRIKFKAVELNVHVYGDMLFKSMPIEVFAVNFYDNGFNRGDSVQTVKAKKIRTAPCIRPFSDFTVSYDGDVFPCCQLYPDAEESKKLAVGSVVRTPDIFAIYGSEKLAGWRRSLFTRGSKDSPCDSCGEMNWPLSRAELDKRDVFFERELGIPRPNLVSRAITQIKELSGRV
jgi:MoaA/NifB/PqqE/SkfB family radical SAM enzyme